MEVTIATARPQADLDLVQRHRYGDSEALGEVYHRYGDMVFNLAYRMSGDRELAADFTQETFLRVHRSLGRFHGRSTLKTWIYRVALNHCRSRLSRRRWKPVPLAEESERGGPQLVDERRDPEQRALSTDRQRIVEEGLQLLPPVFREAVVLCDLQGLSYEEIASVLGVRIGTVRSRIARGREKLRVLLVKNSGQSL
ncbi:MAG: sigma-70 family RNA polymerase sigma factor [Deltaproteobacteria bacterium]|nr:sigma-70 family RNA polymerase sigma factor [Deltaproteobacteria bacterium]